MRVVSGAGGILQVRLDNSNGPVVVQIEIPKSNDWSTIKTPLSGVKAGVHHLFVSLKDNRPVEVDWIRFE